jgi:hypothetical protein
LENVRTKAFYRIKVWLWSPESSPLGAFRRLDAGGIRAAGWVLVALGVGIALCIWYFIPDGLLRSTLLGSISFPTGIWAGVLAQELRKAPAFKDARRGERPCSALFELANLIPGRRARKVVVKMLAEQQEDIVAFRAAGKYKMARWHSMCTWWLFAWYVLKGPIAALRRALSMKERM